MVGKMTSDTPKQATPTPEKEKKNLNLRGFPTLLGAQIFGVFADSFVQFLIMGVLIVLVTLFLPEALREAAEHGANGWVRMMYLVPMFLLTPFAGFIVDRYRRKNILIISAIFKIVLLLAAVLLIPFLPHEHGILKWAMLAIILGIGLGTAFYAPAKSAILPNLVSPEKLLLSNSIVSSLGLIVTLASGILCGAIVDDALPSKPPPKELATEPIINILIAAMVLYGIATVLYALIRYRTPEESTLDKTKDIPGEKRKTAIRDLLDGVKFILGNKGIIGTILVCYLFWGIAGLFNETMQELIKSVASGHNYEKNKMTFIGLYSAFLGFGIVSGALYVGMRASTWIRPFSYPITIILLGASIVFTSQATSLFSLGFGFFFSGLMSGIMIAPIEADLLGKTPDNLRGKVLAVNNLAMGCFIGAILIAKFFLGELSTESEVIATREELLLYCGIFMLVIGVTFFFINMKRLKWSFVKTGNFLFFLFMNLIGRLFLRIFFLLKVEGKENIPAKGPCIIAPNHASFSDPVVLQAAIDRHIVFMMTSDFYETQFKWLFRMLGCINVVEGAAIQALRDGGRALKEERALGIFPEGQISHDGNMNKGQPGVASLARKKIPIIPIALTNTFKFMPRWAKFPRWVRLKVLVGKPIVREEGEGHAHLTWRVMQSISEMTKLDNPNNPEPDFK